MKGEDHLKLLLVALAIDVDVLFNRGYLSVDSKEMGSDESSTVSTLTMRQKTISTLKL